MEIIVSTKVCLFITTDTKEIEGGHAIESNRIEEDNP